MSESELIIIHEHVEVGDAITSDGFKSDRSFWNEKVELARKIDEYVRWDNFKKYKFQLIKIKEDIQSGEMVTTEGFKDDFRITGGYPAKLKAGCDLKRGDWCEFEFDEFILRPKD